MSVERFFLDGFRDKEAYELLKSSPIFPLVRELEFKYGLKVLRSTVISDNKIAFNPSITAWLMCHKNGIAVGKAYMSKTAQGKDEFCWRSPYYIKERGESREDKQTIRSVKISSLMATLTRQKVVPDLQAMESKKLSGLSEAVSLVSQSFGNSNKSTYDLSPDEVHAIMLMALGKSPNSEWVKIDSNKCQDLLDKWEKADIVRKEKVEESKRFFTNPFYLIGVDEFNEYIVGKFKTSDAEGTFRSYETIEPFKRYKSYEEIPDIIPVMTMTKLAYEDKQVSSVGVIPQIDAYNADLDAVFFYNTRPTHYDHLYMATPCPI